MSFRELLDLTQEWAGRSRGYLPMPFWLAKLQAMLTWPLPNGLRPITLDQVRMLQHDNVVSAAAKSEGRTLAGLGVSAPHGVAAIVPTYLERFRAARAVRQLSHLARRSSFAKQKGSGGVPEPRSVALDAARALSARWRSPGRRRWHGRSRPAACRSAPTACRRRHAARTG